MLENLATRCIRKFSQETFVETTALPPKQDNTLQTCSARHDVTGAAVTFTGLPLDQALTSEDIQHSHQAVASTPTRSPGFFWVMPSGLSQRCTRGTQVAFGETGPRLRTPCRWPAASGARASRGGRQSGRGRMELRRTCH